MTPARTASLAFALAIGLGGCATPPAPFDYTSFIEAKPVSLLVLPPLNDSPEVGATSAVWAQATRPLAEAGYYVFPVTLVDETFRQNGMNEPGEIQLIPLAKLREFFGADAAVYLRVRQYGTRYALLASGTTVEVEGRIVDLRSGKQLWAGAARASSAEQSQHSQGGLAGLLVTAVVKQIVETSMDASFVYAGIANERLLGVRRYNGILAGPRSPYHGQPPTTAR